eukprot:gene843-7315_t
MSTMLAVVAAACIITAAPAGAYLCPDGSEGLTPALYETGNYEQVQCILPGAFWDYNGDVTLDQGMPNLVSIGEYAFRVRYDDSIPQSYSGTLTIGGSFPLLSTIGRSAFGNAGNANSKIELLGGLMSNLASIGNGAFSRFGGTLTFTGSFPLLSTIGYAAFNAFGNSGNANSKIELLGGLMPNLTSIGCRAFSRFGGTLEFMGTFPLLSRIGASFGSDCEGLVFERISDANSKIELIDMPALTSIDGNAFYGFNGTLIVSGSFPLLASIHEEAFKFAGNDDSRIEWVDGLPKLVGIADSAFHSFRGTVAFSGSFPLLSNIGSSAFLSAFSANSKIELVGELVPQLAAISEFAFLSFGGRLVINGSFPNLANIGNLAFSEAGSNSYITIACSSEAGLQLSSGAFAAYLGFHDASREQCPCSDKQCTPATAPPPPPDTTPPKTTPPAATTASAVTTPVPLFSDAHDRKQGRKVGIAMAILAAAAVLIWQRQRVHACVRSLFCCNQATSRLEAELCDAAKERAQLTFLSKYSRHLFSTMQSVDDYAALVTALELPRANIKVVRQLGSGNYGSVITVEVAVKSRLPGETDATVDEALLVEALVLHSLSHPHILGLVGICTTSLPFFVATELMMQLCWSADPKRRPRFADLVQALGAIRGAVAVGPEASMILDSNGELVQQAGRWADANSDQLGTVSNVDLVAPRQPVLQSSSSSIGSRLPVDLDGYVEDNFEHEGQPVLQSSSSSSRLPVDLDGYVQDNSAPSALPELGESSDALVAQPPPSAIPSSSGNNEWMRGHVQGDPYGHTVHSARDTLVVEGAVAVVGSSIQGVGEDETRL